ncbi:MAG: RtcB family protein, partial [Thermoplasmata archaeon]
TLLTKVKFEEIMPYLHDLAKILFERIPAGLGSEGAIKLDIPTLDEILEHGAHWAVEFGYGHSRDLEYTEERGRIKSAVPAYVSNRAKNRELKQLGTLGSGNHYLEIQHVSEIYNEKAAKIFGLELNDVVVSLHTGSRALGHQVGSDYLSVMSQAAVKYGIKESLREKELASAPINSEEGQAYFGAISAAFNLAFANRQVITHLVREVFAEVAGIQDLPLLYDVGHNTCKIEEHIVDGQKRKLYVHRKGATRAFGPGKEDLPEKYRSIGQPVLIGGTMGTASYVLLGTELAMQKSFGSACHGAGRRLSRHAAARKFRAHEITTDLREKGIIIKGHSKAGISEEAPEAYKNVDEIAEIMHSVKIATKVSRLTPLVVIKG